MNNYKLFNIPKKAFEELHSALQGAKQSIYMDMYAIRDDKTGRRFLRKLAQKSEEIQVVLITDDWGSRRYSKKTKRIISTSKIEFVVYNPIVSGLLDIRHFEKRGRTRNHRKLIVIDHKTAYVGGMNIHSGELTWRDFYVKIQGPIVSILEKEFWEMYRIAKTNSLTNPPTNKLNSTKNLQNDCVLRQIPHTTHQEIYKTVLQLIKQAKKSVRICTPYFAPTKELLRTLGRAVQKGVQVSILTAEKTDYSFSTVLNKLFAEEARVLNIVTNLYPGMVHAKYFIIDNAYVSFGSANLDQQTKHSNFELNILSKSRELYKQFNAMWKEDKQKSTIYTKRIWIERSFINKILEPILLQIRKYF